eukprot:5074944-Prymnesium_polylepis.1
MAALSVSASATDASSSFSWPRLSRLRLASALRLSGSDVIVLPSMKMASMPAGHATAGSALSLFSCACSPTSPAHAVHSESGIFSSWLPKMERR